MYDCTWALGDGNLLKLDCGDGCITMNILQFIDLYT